MPRWIRKLVWPSRFRPTPDEQRLAHCLSLWEKETCLCWGSDPLMPSPCGKCEHVKAYRAALRQMREARESGRPISLEEIGGAK